MSPTKFKIPDQKKKTKFKTLQVIHGEQVQCWIIKMRGKPKPHFQLLPMTRPIWDISHVP